ncbi:hypothetical protein EYF80_018716 [Liparis tanakae]|uniref:Uncharacterized protein n=1 Tax=Liparis tanakae TaxID=230148 RepID=A0A4Z2I0E3_9TELE|nr:hypothetical protein EYF80_018716 [Liparis tanakae]
MKPNLRPGDSPSDMHFHYRLGVGGVVGARQRGVAEVGLQQQMGLGVGAVVGVRVDLQGEQLSQLAVQLVLVVSDGKLGVLFCFLRDRDQSGLLCLAQGHFDMRTVAGVVHADPEGQRQLQVGIPHRGDDRLDLETDQKPPDTMTQTSKPRQ